MVASFCDLLEEEDAERVIEEDEGSMAVDRSCRRAKSQFLYQDGEVWSFWVSFSAQQNEEPDHHDGRARARKG